MKGPRKKWNKREKERTEEEKEKEIGQCIPNVGEWVKTTEWKMWKKKLRKNDFFFIHSRHWLAGECVTSRGPSVIGVPFSFLFHSEDVVDCVEKDRPTKKKEQQISLRIRSVSRFLCVCVCQQSITLKLWSIDEVDFFNCALNSFGWCLLRFCVY